MCRERMGRSQAVVAAVARLKPMYTILHLGTLRPDHACLQPFPFNELLTLLGYSVSQQSCFCVVSQTHYLTHLLTSLSLSLSLFFSLLYHTLHLIPVRSHTMQQQLKKMRYETLAASFAWFGELCRCIVTDHFLCQFSPLSVLVSLSKWPKATEKNWRHTFGRTRGRSHSVRLSIESLYQERKRFLDFIAADDVCSRQYKSKMKREIRWGDDTCMP